MDLINIFINIIIIVQINVYIIDINIIHKLKNVHYKIVVKILSMNKINNYLK